MNKGKVFLDQYDVIPGDPQDSDRMLPAMDRRQGPCGRGFSGWNWLRHDPLLKYCHALEFLMECTRSESELLLYLRSWIYHLRERCTLPHSRFNLAINYTTSLQMNLFSEMHHWCLGIKKKFPKEKISTYYSFGLKREYNLSTNLDKL